MTAHPYLLQLADPDQSPARFLPDGNDTFVVMAESSDDALAFVQNYTSPKVFANVTPAVLAEATSMLGWRLRVSVFNTDHSLLLDQIVTNAGQSENTDFASDVLTSSANYSDAETVTIGANVYTMQDTLTNVAGHVKIGVTEALTILNLHNAINGSGGVSGTDYAAATVAHPDVTAVDNAAHTVTVTAKVAGVAGNSIAATETSATASWAAATLLGGAATSNKMSSLAELMAVALNATGLVAGAAFNDTSHVLTVAGTSDNLGDHTLLVQVLPPSSDYQSPVGVSTVSGTSVPGFVGSVTDGGSAGSALTVALAADTYGVPSMSVKARVQT